MRSILLLLAREREKDHRVHEAVVSISVETIFTETSLIMSHHVKAMASKAQDNLIFADTTNHLCQRMIEPREFDLRTLECAALYLVGKPKAATQ